GPGRTGPGLSQILAWICGALRVTGGDEAVHCRQSRRQLDLPAVALAVSAVENHLKQGEEFSNRHGTCGSKIWRNIRRKRGKDQKSGGTDCPYPGGRAFGGGDCFRHGQKYR